MKKNCKLTLAVLAATTVAVQAQVQTASSLITAEIKQEMNAVPFSVEAEGKQFPVIWGMDTAWPSEDNMKRGIAFIGTENLGTARASFQPSDLIVNGELSKAQQQALDNRLRIVALSGVKDIALNCDHEVMNKDNYYGKPEEWVKMIEASVIYCQKKGFNVVSVAPFNEPDYTPWGEGSISDFYNIARLLKQNPLFDNIRICGGNTLNCDQALTWYNALKEYLDEGNTHQLAGEFDTYANFFTTVRADGKHATADELHNVMEAMVGVEYGMQTGIWWGFDARARGEFCRASNNGDRLAYTEDRAHWTAAAVYRNNKEQTVQAFIGSSERQAGNSTYRFLSTDRNVYFDGYGPVREYTVDMPGGTGYQTGQTNAEYVADITWGEDVPPYINGNYVIQSAATGERVISLPLANTAEGSNIVQKKHVQKATYQQWKVMPVSNRIGGDFSYYTITSLGNNSYNLDVLNYSLNEGGNIIAYRQNLGAQQQWYLKYAGEGYFYIISRHSNLCLQVTGAGENAVVTQGRINGSDKQKWRFVPAGLKSETTPPAAPENLTATAQTASILLNWTLGSETDLKGYDIFRAELPMEGEDTLYNTIAREVKTDGFLDNDVRQGIKYIYKIKATDKIGNRSQSSNTAEAQTISEKALVCQLQMDDTLADATINRMDATIYGTAVYTPVCKSGTKSLMFNGTDNYLKLPYAIANMHEMTICTWVRMRATTSWQRIFDFGNGTQQYMFLTPTHGSEMRFVMKNGGEEEILATNPIKQSTWTHVAITISNEAVILYINGEEAARSTSMNIRPDDIHPTLNYIGRSQFNADPLLKAFVDDFRIYNYALTPAEIVDVTQDLEADHMEIQTEDDAPIVNTEYYSTSGIQLTAPVKGITIVKHTHANGKVTIEKQLKK